MKTKVLFTMVIVLLCTLSLNAQKGKEKLKVVADTVAVDSTEYELVVFDPGFETWLLMKPKNMHSDSYYRAKNLLYVTEWNSRYMNQLNNSALYDSYIDYRADIDYGYDFDYRLYYYFVYFEEVNRVSLLPGRSEK
jgi:hypothetical protein